MSDDESDKEDEMQDEPSEDKQEPNGKNIIFVFRKKKPSKNEFVGFYFEIDQLGAYCFSSMDGRVTACE
jgi:hypothetical protein